MTESKRFNSFGMEKMKQKDEEARLERMNTKQKRGTPTVRGLLIKATNPYFLAFEEAAKSHFSHTRSDVLDSAFRSPTTNEALCSERKAS